MAQIFWNGAIAWFGSCSGRIGARIAIVTQNSRMAAPSMPIGLSRSSASAPRKLPSREGAAGVWLAVVLAMVSAEPDARVEQGVADVGDELREHGHEHRDQRAGLDQVDVAEDGAVVEQLAEARDRRRTPRPRSRRTSSQLSCSTMTVNGAISALRSAWRMITVVCGRPLSTAVRMYCEVITSAIEARVIRAT